MGSLLKDVLLRHQQWEEEVERQRNVSNVQETRTAPTGNDAVPKIQSSLSNLSDSDAAVSTDLAHHGEGTKNRTRHRTRPPGLRASVAEVNVRDDGASRVPATASPATTGAAAVGSATSFTAAASQSSSASITVSPSPSLSASLALPFTPYPVQQEMCATVANVLKSCKPHVVPVAITEVPTGCGKTMALLSGVLRYQQELKRMTPGEAATFVHARRPPWQHAAQTQKSKKRGGSSGNKNSSRGKGRAATDGHAATSVAGNDAGGDDSDSDNTEDGADAGWTVPRSFFKQFSVNSQRKIRAELDVTGSQELRRRFLPPPCTVYYVTRTHAQLRQAVRELRHLHGASGAIRMNILGSREHYCIHPKVLQAKANHTLPVEGNNLGEVCDKLVSMGLCEMAEKCDELSCSAIGGAIGHQRGLIWDMEDLVLEGAARNMCPYYAARDLVFFADINFCTYPYLLDPLIRHETKMEAALKNNAIVVFDEAHNVPAVCQDALSLECPRGVLDLILSELGPLLSNSHALAHPAATPTLGSGASHSEGVATLQYPRELHLGSYTLVEIFSFLHTLFQSISAFVDKVAGAERAGAAAYATTSSVSHRGEKRPRDTGREGGADAAYIQGAVLEHHLRSDMEAFMRTLNRQADARGGSPALSSLDLFQRSYGVIMSLGVTFNPFLFSVFGLSMLKRWLLLLRFFLPKSCGFVLKVRSDSPAEGAAPAATSTTAHREETTDRRGGDDRSGSARCSLPVSGGTSGASRTVVEVRCLDGSLAFHHLLRSVHRVVLASGTLAPFTQLTQDLGLTPSQWRGLEGLHVVPDSQHRLTALTCLPSSATSSATVPLRCTYASLSDPSFLKIVARCVVQLALTVQRSSSNGGGVLFFVPNYAVLHSLAKITRELLHISAQERGWQSDAPPIPLFLEPRTAEALTQVLREFECRTQGPCGGTALLFSVYRGKVSEGIDFTDNMARLVICLGVPLQPLKSWKVAAQRVFSGPAWYTSDAVRAVNQALGRCLRHARDYGAVVLLDERYAQAEYQQRLSRWCRATLQTESSLANLCHELQGAFTQWRWELETPLLMPSAAGVAEGGPKGAEVGEDGIELGDTASASAASSSALASARGLELDAQLTQSQARGGDGARVRLGTDQLPFQLVRRTAQHCRHHATENATPYSANDVHADRFGNGSTTIDSKAAGAVRTEAVAGEGLLHSPFACTAVKLLYETACSTGDVSRRDLHAAIALLAESFLVDDVESSSQE
ncbi:putative mitochondrial Helicase-like protein [Leptomonas pyrrhocoris]|uniref:Putative mitochondrial Helicase-like protein n=1 Tax=Leptomonas pyrrhocoris TaxID=157538 RepID=A0A0M9G967_LEPPY|nr:putative mitochondrial Helicase-like protein [Leptomonas pyrrhocoris]KPA85307.1 putative mitochondrial Helicase-like protein [Leptomonas pyrrhocoris]|eukprot:XP_015663746.1 putative mitochondrial Helicase-like protein [Leptomonas pyrrhocoris]